MTLRRKLDKGERGFTVFDLLPGQPQFDMTKLETEYDYDTDAETVQKSHKMLEQDLYYAVEFFV